MDDFAGFLKGYRALMRISQRELALQLYGVPRRTLEDWESGKSVPAPYVCRLVRERCEQLMKKGKEDSYVDK